MSDFLTKPCDSPEFVARPKELEREILERTQAEEVLRQSEERFRLLVQNSSDIITIFGADGTVHFQSQSLERILGRRPEERIGKNIFQDPIVHPDDAAKKRAFFEEALRHPGSNVTAEFRLRHADGSWRDLEAIGRNLLDDPRIAGILANYRDMTERKRAEDGLRASEARQGAVLEASLDGIIIFDHEGRIVELNPAVEAMFGSPRAEMVGKQINEMIIKGNLYDPLCRGPVPFLATGEGPGLGHRVEMVALRADGSEFPVELTVVRNSQDGEAGPPWFIGFVRDITEQKHAADLKQLVAAVVESSDDAIISKTLEGVITSWNKSAERIFGYSAEEVVGKHVSLLMPPERVEDMTSILERVRRGERVDHYETKRRTKDGRILDISLSVSPVRDLEGHIVGAAKVARDITERKRAEEKFRLAVESAPNAMVMVDRAGRIVLVNAQTEKLFGYGRDELLGQSVELLVPERFQGAHPDHRAGFYAHPEARAMGVGRDLSGRRKDGSEFPVEIGLNPIATDEGLLVLSAIVDITERKRVEQELSRRAQELHRAKEAAEAANRAKDQFLAVLSHELRTPLTPVLLAVSALLDDPDTDADLLPTFSMIRRQVELEARLIDDLLDVTLIAQGKMRLKRETVDAHASIHQSLNLSRGDLDAGRFQLAVDLSAAAHHVAADPVRLQQVFGNLLKNAIKFTPMGGTIALRSRNQPGPGPDGPHLIIEICDSGIGIAPEVLPRIFRAFEQGEAPLRRRFGGLGLGLAISRSVVEAHGGRLSAVSAGQGRGTTLILELATVPEPVAAPPAPDAAPPLRSLKILLVEDNPDTLQTLARLLSQQRHTVRAVARLSSAREAAAEGDFDLVLSDIQLPDGTGLELMRELGRGRAVPGIAFSGFGSEEDIRQSQAAGFAAHLIKPIDACTLEATIARIVPGAGV